MLLAIDPGKVGLGWAVFATDTDGGPLIRCGVVPPLKGHPHHKPNLGDLCTHAIGTVQSATWIAPKITTVVVEQMQARSMREVSDLLMIQAIAASVAGYFDCPITYYTPDQWKGSVPKTVMERRIRSRLSAGETALLPTGSKAHNAIDAVGIGLHHLGRL